MYQLRELEALRKKEWRTFLFKKHWFLNLTLLLFLLGCLLNLTLAFFPELFQREHIEPLSFQTKEEATRITNHRTQEGGIIFGFVFGILFICFALCKVHFYFNQFVRNRELTPFKLAYNNWLASRFDGDLTFQKESIEFNTFSDSALHQGVKGVLLSYNELLNVQLYRSVGSYNGIWKRCTMNVGNVQQVSAFKHKGSTQTTVVFDALFISIQLPDYVLGKLMIRRDKTEKLGLKALQRSKSKWGKLIRIEDAEFEKQFKVYGSESIANGWLNPDVRKALILAKNQFDADLSVSVIDGVFSIALPNNTGLLNPSVARKVDTKKIDKQLQKISNLIAQLDLNPQRGYAV